MRRTTRNTAIAAAVAAGRSARAVAVEHDLSPARVGQIARMHGVATTPGRRVTGAATHHTARGRALLARLVADAEAAGIEAEAYLDRARKNTAPPRGES